MTHFSSDLVSKKKKLYFLITHFTLKKKKKHKFDDNVNKDYINIRTYACRLFLRSRTTICIVENLFKQMVDSIRISKLQWIPFRFYHIGFLIFNLIIIMLQNKIAFIIFRKILSKLCKLKYFYKSLEKIQIVFVSSIDVTFKLWIFFFFNFYALLLLKNKKQYNLRVYITKIKCSN